jgi:8-oxo-dGTP diphosphatase
VARGVKARAGNTPATWSYEYPRPAVAVDMVVLTVVDLDPRILLIRRGQPPFVGAWALPGGFVRVSDDGDQGEDLDEAAARELKEETGLSPREVLLEQLRAFGRPGRDPRGRVISVAYTALVPADRMARVRAGDDAAHAEWVGTARLPKLAFDHAEIIAFALADLRARIDGDLRLAQSLLPAAFTKAELRQLYEVVTGLSYDRSNFNKRLNRLIEDGRLEVAPGRRPAPGPGRPADLYRFA